MAFKRLLAGLGFGGASVETVLAQARAHPGGRISGEVHIEGGSVEQRIDLLTVGLQARVEVEAGDHEGSRNIEFLRQEVGGELDLRPGERHAVPFELPVPWETPITTYRGSHLRRMDIGVNTRLHVAGGVDPGDLDGVEIRPLPAHEAVLDALDRLGFRFKQADMESGRLRGTRQRLPFFQEIEFFAPRDYQGLNELELTFVTDERGADVILEMDKKPGVLFSEGRDSFHRFAIEHTAVDARDWADYLHRWIDSIAGRRSWL